MFEYIKNKIKKYNAKRVFHEYEYKALEFDLGSIGKVKYAQWLNPLERSKEITVSKVEFFKKFIKPGSIAIDIGAHTGDTPIPMALAAGPTGKVLAFEPNPYIFKILLVNVDLNKGKTNIIPLNYAVTVDDGEFFYSSSEASFNNGGISDVEPDKHGKFAMQTKVKGLNLEKYLKANHADDLNKLALIKVDTEGYDKEILKSIQNVIRDYKPVVIFECFGKLTREEREELYDLIAQHGYTLHYFEDFVVDTPVQKISKADMMNWKHFDIYALPTK
jgi:FkbM family methyltransferase